MLKRILELFRAVVLSFETLVALVAFGGFSLLPELEKTVGAFVATLGAYQLGILGIFATIFGFSLARATAILKPSDALVIDAIQEWPGLHILEMRVKATLIWNLAALGVAGYTVMVGKGWEPATVGKALLSAAVVALIAAYSIWDAEMELHKIARSIPKSNKLEAGDGKNTA